MKRESFVFLLGIAVIVIPFLGIPRMWRQVLLAFIGASLILIGYQLRRQAYVRSIERDAGERHADVYVENVTPEVPLAVESPLPPKRRSRTKRV